MIIVAHIIPTAYLKRIPVSTFYMVLPHKLLHDTKYFNFYRRKVKEGAWVILDNGAFEFGQALNDNLLLEALEILNPSEFVLPDVLENSRATIEKSFGFIERIKKKNKMKFMGVPHGTSLSEWIECYYTFSKSNLIYSVGLGAIYTKRVFSSSSYYLNGRIDLSTYLHTHGYANIDKSHHLLGLGDSGHIELTIQNKFPWIKSCDSSAAFTQAILAKKIESNAPYIKNTVPLDFSCVYKENIKKLLINNMLVLDESSR